MNVQVIDPRSLTAVEWTDFMIQALDAFAELPSIDTEEEWQLWATVAVSAPALARTNPPSPIGFTDWREWAMRFNQSIDLVSTT